MHKSTMIDGLTFMYNHSKDTNERNYFNRIASEKSRVANVTAPLMQSDKKQKVPTSTRDELS